MGTIADIYARVSTPAQLKGDSIRRQTAGCRRFCEMTGRTVRNSITDAHSSWKPDFLTKGTPGKAILGWIAGVEEPPDFLIIEDWDRFSRQGVGQSLKLLRILDLLGTTVCAWYGSPEFEENKGLEALAREKSDQEAEKRRQEREEAEEKQLNEQAVRSMEKARQYWAEVDRRRTSQALTPADSPRTP